MAQARLSEEQVNDRKQQIERLEARIQDWELLGSKEKGLERLREAIRRCVAVEEKTIADLVKTLSFSSDADKLNLAKHTGRLEFANSIYYDISEAPQKIDGARLKIAQLASEIKRAKAGELVEVGERI